VTAWEWDVQSLELDPKSATWVASLLKTTPHGNVEAVSAVAKVTAENDASCYTCTFGGKNDSLDASFKVPHGTLPCVTSDRHLLIVDEVTGRTQDMWEAKFSNGKLVGCAAGLGYPTDPVTAYTPKGKTHWSTNAADVPTGPSLIWPEDVAAGICSHTLRFVFHNPSHSQPRFPAAPWAQPYPPGLATPANPPVGVLVRLNKSAVIAKGAGKLETCVFNTLKKLGAVGTDGGSYLTFKGADLGGGLQGTKDWNAVGIQVVQLPAGNAGALHDPGMSAVFSRIPWNKLEVVTPPAA
jgi:hypothetical protein